MELKRVRALVRLLDDPNRIVFEAVKAALLKEGSDVIPVLIDIRQDAHKQDLILRIDEIISRIEMADIQSALIDWLHSGATDLLYGAFIASRLETPRAEFGPIDQQVNNLWRDMRIDVKEASSPIARIEVINRLFFDQLGFAKNLEEPTSPLNNCIGEVLSTKRGNHITLSIIYSEMCRRMGLPIQCVSLPKVLILCFLADTVLRTDNMLEPEDIQFYINPSASGAILHLDDIITFLDKQHISPSEQYYLPCSNIEVVKRLLINLLYAYTAHANDTRIHDAKILIQTIDNYTQNHPIGQ